MDMVHYRGLSGLDSALFAFVAVSFLREQRRGGDKPACLVTGGFLIGFILKVVFELATGRTLFVTRMGVDVVGVPLAHIIGAAVGIVFCVARTDTAPVRLNAEPRLT